MTSPVISVVMATYNGEQFIAEAIDSILNQSFKDFEFIIVDDGSKDNTFSIISSYADPRIKYIKKENNSGIADSLNFGISKATGKYIARMDDDDVSFPERLKVQFEFLENNPEYILCASNVELSDKSKNRIYLKENHSQLQMKLLFFNPIVHPTVMIKSDVLALVKYDASMPPSEDYDLWSRLIDHGKFIKLQTPLLHYRHDDNSETTLRRKEQLQLNVRISRRIFENVGFIIDSKEKFLHKALISHDYSLNYKKIPSIMEWLSSLNFQNKEKNIFDFEKFSNLIENINRNYLISYFANNIKQKKLKTFIGLDIKSKILICKHYLINYLRIDF